MNEDGAPTRKPEYRLRLFLSVDLVGSTAFKSRDSQSNLVWIKAFQKFYGQFPKLFQKKYDNFCSIAPEIDAIERACTPKVWKTIGDEILFANRVHSVAHLSAYVSAFREALIDFGEELRTFSLNTKGNAWIAAFPTPNRSIQLSLKGNTDLFGENDDILTEEAELAVDQDPGSFDFLGKGIDSGFRISRNSDVDAMTLSPGLAYLLCRAKRNRDTTKFSCDFSFSEPQAFKGVVGGRKYPVISLITSRDKNNEDIEKLESKLLDRPREANIDDLFDYLEKYIKVNEIDKPELKLSYRHADVESPDYYQKYIKEWEEDFAKIERQKKTEQESALPLDAEEALQTNAEAKDKLTKILRAVQPEWPKEEDVPSSELPAE